MLNLNALSVKTEMKILPICFGIVPIQRNSGQMSLSSSKPISLQVSLFALRVFSLVCLSLRGTVKECIS